MLVTGSEAESALCAPLTCEIFSCIRLFATLWTRQISLSTEFSRQEHWSGLPFPSPGGLPNPGTEHTSPVSPELVVGSSLLGHQGSLCALKSWR